MSYKIKVARSIIEKYNKRKEERDKKLGKNKNIKKIQHGNKTIIRFEGKDKLSYELNLLSELIEELELQ